MTRPNWIQFRTESGSVYSLDSQRMTWEREPNANSPLVRQDYGDLLVWPEVHIGQGVDMYGTGLTFGVRVMRTSPVTEIINAG